MEVLRVITAVLRTMHREKQP